MTTILKTSFSTEFSCRKIVVCWFKFHWNLFPRVQSITIQHWFRQWFGNDQAMSHYLNQWEASLLMHICITWPKWFNSLRPRQNGRLFADDTFKRIFLNENIRISTKNPLKFVPKGLMNNIPALVLIMAWRRPGDMPLSEPMLVRSLTHICVTRPQWVKGVDNFWNYQGNMELSKQTLTPSCGNWDHQL